MFTIEELAEKFERTRLLEEQRAGLFHHHPLITLYYEELVDDMDTAVHRLTDFLNVPYFRPTTNLERQNPEQLRDLITNYDELRSGFAGTEWEQFFYD